MIAALLVLSAAWVWPLAFFASELFFAHMMQHVLVMNLAALLMAAAWPAGKRLQITLPAVTALQIAALWVWHMPAIVAVAHHSPALQGLMQASLFAVALLFWKGIFDHARPVWHRIFALLITAKLFCLLGAAFVFSRRTLYPAFGSPEAFGLTALEDQQLAGLLMVSSCALIYVAAAIALFGNWLFAIELRQSVSNAATIAR